MVMPIRVALTSVPPWQLAAAVLIMIASVLGLVRVAARLYRGAVLQTGGKVRLGTAWRLGAA
jgi:ABC-2 type transport system permease protein